MAFFDAPNLCASLRRRSCSLHCAVEAALSEARRTPSVGTTTGGGVGGGVGGGGGGGGAGGGMDDLVMRKVADLLRTAAHENGGLSSLSFLSLGALGDWAYVGAFVRGEEENG